MTWNSEEELLAKYFQDLTGKQPASLSILHPHASQRRMYRIADPGVSVIGVINPLVAENDAFVSFARHFRAAGLPVPEVYRYEPAQHLYLLEDLGNTTLLNALTSARAETSDPFPPQAEALYRQVLTILPRFQIEAGRTIDYTKCYPNSDFSSDALRSDMASFVQELVPRILPDYETKRLEADFNTLITSLSGAQGGFFLYRDFQSRNIMVVKNHPYFIDFQGGRKGPLQYDVVSLLYQSSARIPEAARANLLEHYLNEAARYTTLNPTEFLALLPAFIISRMLQVLGVYGREGLGAGKEYFASSIPSALATLSTELCSETLPIKLPNLTLCVRALLERLR